MSVPSRFSDPQYTNWLRCVSSLMILKESLHDYTEVVVKSLHNNVKVNVTAILGPPHQCSACSWKGIRLQHSTGIWSIGCNICNIWLGEILKKHDDPQSRTINWGNADITEWSTEPWEIAKIFMTNGQRNKTDLPRELDSPALLSLLKYCKEFHPLNVQLVSNIIEIRNKVLHCPDLRVRDTDKDAWIGCMLLLVSDLNIQGVAYTNIYKLKMEDIDISFQEQEIKVLQNIVSMVQNDVNTLKDNIDSLTNTQSQHREEINEVKGTAGENKAKIIALQTQTQQLETDLKGQKFQMETNAQVISTLKTFIDNNPDLCKIKISEELRATLDEISAVKSQLQTVESQLVNIQGELILIRVDQEGMKREVTTVRGEQEKMRVEHHTIKGEISFVKDEQKNIMVEHEVVKAYISTVKSEQEKMRVEHEVAKGERSAVKSGQEKMRVEQETAKREIAAVKDEQEKMRNQIENLEQNQREIQTEIQPPTLSTVDIQRLQKDLLHRYKFLNVIPISPLHESYTTLLDDIFTSVIIEKNDKENVGNLREQVQPRVSKKSVYLRSYHQLFGDKGNKRLILTGFMGSGKTVFCRKVVQTWCWVKSAQVDPRPTGERQAASTSALDDEDILSQFEFLFFIDLAKVTSQEDLLHAIHRHCSIPNDIDMIETKNFLCKLLQNMPEKILIILDGLDEMGSQTPVFVNDLLERKLYPQISVFVSTRPWQVSKLNLQAHSHYDLLLTVQGFDEKNALNFATKVIHAHDKDVSDSLIMDVIVSLKKKKIFETFRSVPLLLLFIINVWFNDRSLPDQYNELYCKIIDCMITRYLNKTKGKNLKWVEMSDSKTKSMKSSVFVKTFGNAFLELTSKFSYEFLLQRQHGTTVIISREELLKILDKDRETAESKLCVLLECGIVLKTDVFSPLERNYSLSFLHLTIQEFFSAIHLILNQDVFQEFLSSWTCLNDVLQNENLVIFTCGLAPDLGTLLFSRICEVCNHDSNVLECRYSFWCNHMYAIENLCSLYRICLSEVQVSVSLPLSDIMINQSLTQNECEDFLYKIMTLGSTSVIKSFRLSHQMLSSEHSESLCRCISNCTQLQTLNLRDITLHDSILDLSRLTGLTRLYLWNVTMSIECNESLCRCISNCTQLQTLNLDNMTLYDSILDLSRLSGLTQLSLYKVTMSSEHSESLCRSISNCTQLQTLDLWNITLHDSILDLSRLTGLTQLSLDKVTMSSECSESLCRSISNCTQLQTLNLDNMTPHDSILDLSRLTGLTRLCLWNVTMSSECNESLCRCISNYTQLQTLNLGNITLHDSIVDLSRLRFLTEFSLYYVTMSSECNESLCKCISNCTQLQTLNMHNITPHNSILDLSRLSGLTRLSLFKVTMSSECSECLCRCISNCTQLQTLNLDNMTLHDSILDLSRLRGLSRLCLWNVTMSSDCNESLCKCISNCTQLQTLNLRNITLHDSIIDLRRLTGLTELTLYNVTMSSECNESLCKCISNCTQLQTLNLHNITPHDSILDLSRLTALTRLSLYKVTMSSECSESLCRCISNCTQLQCLNLHDITLHDSILDLSRLTDLTVLKLWNVTMSSDCSESLCRYISNCTQLQTLKLCDITLHDSILDLSRLRNMIFLSILRVHMSSLCHRVLSTSAKALPPQSICIIEKLMVS